MSQITRINARQILDSRGFPTVEVDVHTASGAWGRAAVPSGASTGSHEALELRDQDPQAFLGKGVRKALKHIEEVLRPALLGQPIDEQRAIDEQMCGLDATPNKSRLGANAILGVSLAIAVAAAADQQLPLYTYIARHAKQEADLLPVPMINILNGGRHADNEIDFQEFMIMPAGLSSFSEAIRVASEIFHHLKQVLKKKGFSTNIGDEGGFAPAIRSNEEAMEDLLEAITAAGYTPGKEVFICLDAASSEYYDTQKARYRIAGTAYDTGAMVDLWSSWTKKYPIFSIEDAMSEDDWDGWKLLSQELKSRVQLVGDDLFVTNPKRLHQGIEEGIANSILIKLNQIGTLTETLDVIEIARRVGYRNIISHRSGETEDHFISDLAVGTAAGQIKAGSMSRSDRLSKYNQLLRIEEALGTRARFAGPEIVSAFHQQHPQS